MSDYSINLPGMAFWAIVIGIISAALGIVVGLLLAWIF